ncbi:MAG: hypothetical protein AAF270_15630 [Pseudomonadota bacterium]
MDDLFFGIYDHMRAMDGFKSGEQNWYVFVSAFLGLTFLTLFLCVAVSLLVLPSGVVTDWSYLFAASYVLTSCAIVWLVFFLGGRHKRVINRLMKTESEERRKTARKRTVQVTAGCLLAPFVALVLRESLLFPG